VEEADAAALSGEQIPLLQPGSKLVKVAGGTRVVDTGGDALGKADSCDLERRQGLDLDVHERNDLLEGLALP
jgi:hypothetical protein